jgi:dipeptidyl aminopeptidase/acylaminoacyl peptidase
LLISSPSWYNETMNVTVYHVTYLSDTYRVKGYLGLPNPALISKQELQGFLLNRYPNLSETPVSIVEEEPENQQSESLRHGLVSPPLPALIYCRGGIGRVGMVKLDWVRLFTSMGFVVFAPSYRGNEGGEGRDEFGGADQEDVHEAFRLLQRLPFVDPKRISLLGFSRGSINATLTASTFPDTYRLIIWGGISDLAKTYEQRVDLRRMLKRVIGGTPAKYPERYAARSPVQMVPNILCPVLVVHGTQDVQVDVSHGVELYHTLRTHGKDVEMHRYIGYGHHLPSPVHEAAVERMLDWLSKKR